MKIIPKLLSAWTPILYYDWTKGKFKPDKSPNIPSATPIDPSLYDNFGFKYIGEDDYTWNYDLNRIVNPYDYRDAWVSKDLGNNTGRYTRNNFSKQEMQGIENREYYDKFTKSLFKDDTYSEFSDFGLDFLKKNDINLPKELRFFDENGKLKLEFATSGYDAWGRPNKDKLNAVQRALWGRTDNTGGGQHNVAASTRTRIFVRDPKTGEKKWIDPNSIDLSKYNIRIGDEYKLDVEEPYYQTDIEILGELPKKLTPNTTLENKPIEFSEGLLKALDDSSKTGGNIKGIGKNDKSNWLSKLKGSNELNPLLLGGMRVLADNIANTRNTEEYISHLHAPLQNPWQAYRMIHGDYIAKLNAELLAATLRNNASRPFTADADKQMSYLLEAIDKGNQAILAGQQRDALEFYRTSELAANQAIQNIQNRTLTANTNRQLLSQYDEMRARLRYNAKTLNMLNWDKWMSTWEDRALAKYDYNLKRALDILEAYDLAYLSTLYDNSSVLAARDKAMALQDYELSALLLAEYNKIIESGLDTAKIKAAREAIDKHNQYKEAYLAFQNAYKLSKLDYYLAMKNYYGFAKNGGILRKMQLGGGFPLVGWTPLMGSPYLQYLALLMSGKEGASSKSSKKSSSSSDKQEASLAKSIIETLKGGDLLLSDIDVIAALMTKFFDLLKYSLDDELDENTLYRGYISMLSQVNKAKLSANNFKLAYDNASKNGGLHEPAVNEQGLVYVGLKGTDKLSVVTPELYFENQDKYILLTNQDLLYLRQNHPSLAFNDTNILSAASNGVGMELVSKFVKEIVGTLGHDKNSRDLLVYNFGELAAQGLKVLEDLKSKGFTSEETNAVMSGGLKALWELNTVTLDLYKQASLAIGAVWQSLPANMRSLLTLRTGSKEGAVDLVSKMILSGTTYESSFKVSDITPLDENGNLKSSTKTGKGGSEGDESLDRTISSFQLGMGGTRDRLVLNPGTKSLFEVDVLSYQLPGAFKTGNLEDVLDESKLAGIISDKTKIYFGDLKIPTEKLSDVAYLGRGFSRAILPIKRDGSPDLTIMSRYEEACEKTRLRGYDPVRIANGEETSTEALKIFGEELQRVELLDLLDRNRLPNLNKMGVFAVTEGIGSTKTGLKLSEFVRLKEDADYDQLKQLLSKKGIDGKVQEYELDDPNWVELWGVLPFYDSIYEGTIYIPISTNELLGINTVGNKVKWNTAKQLELDYQSLLKLLLYNPAGGDASQLLLN